MTEQLDFDFQARGFVNLAGRLVYDGTDVPVPGALVWYMIQEPDGNFYGDVTTFTDATGRFAFADVPAPGRPITNGYAVLLTGENEQGLIHNEFYDNADDEWGAQWIPIQCGITYDIGNWQVAPFTP